jgi:tyrosinase
MNSPLRVRRSLEDLQRDYEAGNRKPLEDLWRAWIGIKSLPPDDRQSFYNLAGYHGAPFRGAGRLTKLYWGGYCNHGNVLFPTWHRIYVLKVEEALQSVPGCADVMLPYWDETSEDSLANGVPWALTRQRVELDGESVANPLRSFVFPAKVVDSVGDDDADYTKGAGYESVRYPKSGLMGPTDINATNAHNAQFTDEERNIKLLNENVAAWLTDRIIIDGKPVGGRVANLYRRCLDAPNYTVFSNGTSADQWDADLTAGIPPVISLEWPHDSIHLAAGGFDIKGVDFEASPIEGANGDMGENDTAAFDPLFFFHHCFVDRMFWLWQKRHGATDDLDIIAEYPGTNSVDSQQPTPGIAPNSWLDLATPLNPFKKLVDGGEVPYTSRDCINIETQLGFTYGTGSLEGEADLAIIGSAADPVTVVAVTGINRAPIRGSFLVSAFANVGGQQVHVGTKAVLSRWNVQYCANCQNHLEVRAFFEVPTEAGTALAAAPADAIADPVNYDVQIQTRDGRLEQEEPAPAAAAAARSPRPLYRVEVRPAPAIV